MKCKPIDVRTFAAASLLAACACGIAAPARAENPVGLYVGAGVGESDVRADPSIFGDPGFARHDTAWKLAAGIRPISLLGAEVDYMDFGRASADFYGAASATRAAATALFGLAYLPLPLPVVDVFGKAGLARLHWREGASFACTTSDGTCVPFAVRQDTTDTRFVYGAGVQAKFLDLAVRFEYERISYGGRDPDMATVGVDWTF